MKIKIIDAKKTQISEENIRDVCEIEIHPALRRQDLRGTPEAPITMGRVITNFEQYFAKLPTNDNLYCLLVKIDNKVVGFLGLHRLEKVWGRHVGEVGLMVHPDFHNKGIGTRLMREIVKRAKEEGFKRLELHTTADNVPMIRIAEKVGFRLEGIQKKRAYNARTCEYFDEAIMGLVFE